MGAQQKNCRCSALTGTAAVLRHSLGLRSHHADLLVALDPCGGSGEPHKNEIRRLHVVVIVVREAHQHHGDTALELNNNFYFFLEFKVWSRRFG